MSTPQTYAYPPAIMTEEEARRYIGDLSGGTFQKAIKEERETAARDRRRALLEPVNIHGRRQGWLTRDLDEWVNRRAGRGESDWGEP